MGRITDLNNKHRKIGKQKLFEAGKTRCEVCGTTSWLSIAHRKTRRHYYACPEKLSDFNEILCLCVPCHQKYEGKTEATELLFKRLRK
jgi:hypothetical protein